MAENEDNGMTLTDAAAGAVGGTAVASGFVGHRAYQLKETNIDELIDKERKVSEVLHNEKIESEAAFEKGRTTAIETVPAKDGKPALPAKPKVEATPYPDVTKFVVGDEATVAPKGTKIFKTEEEARKAFEAAEKEWDKARNAFVKNETRALVNEEAHLLRTGLGAEGWKNSTSITEKIGIAFESMSTKAKIGVGALVAATALAGAYTWSKWRVSSAASHAERISTDKSDPKTR